MNTDLKYIENDKLFKKYQYKFINILSKSEPNYKDKGDVLELFIALRDFKSSNLTISSNYEVQRTLLYEDVPTEIKNKYDLTYKDTGIDLIKIDIENNKILEIIQCKNYSRRLSHHKLGTFYYWILKLHEYDNSIKCRLIINDKTRYNGELIGLEIETITNNDIYEYIESNINLFQDALLSAQQSKFDKFIKSLSGLEILHQIKDCLDKFNLIYSNEIKIVIDPNTLDDINEVCYFDFDLNNEQLNKNKFISNDYLKSIIGLLIIFILICLIILIFI